MRRESLSNNERSFLVELINTMLPEEITGAEIGVFKGETSTAVFGSCDIKRMHLIDPWEGADSPNYKTVLDLFANEDGVQIHRLKSEAAADCISELLDFVFIDGAHDYDSVTTDLMTWIPKVKSDGLISGHDWHGENPQVVQSICDYCSQHSPFKPPLQRDPRLSFRHCWAPSKNPMLNKSWPEGSIWWGIKK